MRIVENLNRALGDLLADRPELMLLGEDIADPYGGAFKVTRGLSTRFPDRVITTPLSEGGIVGVGAGLALAGDGAIVELMFGDFAALAFDQIVNFASKSVSMYGRRIPVPLLIRCPTGGGRGYGPTHSQCPQKHFIGVPGLSLYEMTPVHDNGPLLSAILDRAEPAMFFEDKLLYSRQLCTGGVVDDLFSYDFVGPDDVARIFVEDPDSYDCVIILPGGQVPCGLRAARTLLVEDEISCLLVVPPRLYPFDPGPLLPILRQAAVVCVAEESTAGGTWGSEVAQRIHERGWRHLRRPVTVVSSADSVIPASVHLEKEVLLQDATIRRAIAGAMRD
jgi:pyruvate dehydrogenase E1 component beta subunit